MNRRQQLVSPDPSRSTPSRLCWSFTVVKRRLDPSNPRLTLGEGMKPGRAVANSVGTGVQIRTPVATN
jgi:hypothetical protein